MLHHLHLQNVGPAPEMTADFSPRLNLITGDNGLGKSFLLDVAWWALTRRWPREINSKLTSGYPARPRDLKRPARIEFSVASRTKDVAYVSEYLPRDQSWTGKAGRPWNPGLVIYAQVDGGFAVWDPARNYWKKRGNVDVQDRLPGYVFTAKEVWDGLKVDVDGRETLVCQGLLADWSNWIREKGPNALRMGDVLRRLSPSNDNSDKLEPGPPLRMDVNDVRDVPSLVTSYAGPVPILRASAGVRRIAALAYMLLWSWSEHRRAVEQLGESPTDRLVLLIDEVESHLHPRWQRSILRSLLHLTAVMNEPAEIQIIAATHSPMVLASAEPMFDPKQDAWFDLDLHRDQTNSRVELRKREFVRLGDVSNWLTSDAFDLKEARSEEGEAAIRHASQLLKQLPPPPLEDFLAADQKLRESIGELDPFFIRWTSNLDRLRGNQ